MVQAIAIGALALPVSAFAAQWQDLATISSTLGNNTGRLCISGGNTDVGCPNDAPLLASGLLTVPGDLRVVGNLYVSGSQSFDGVTFTNGGISATGPISATSLNINGVPVSAGLDDRLVSGTNTVYANGSGSVSFTSGGITTAYIMNGRFVGSSVSTTGTVSATDAFLTTGLTLGYGNTGITTTGKELMLEQTGDDLGRSRLYLRSRNGSAGAVFEVPDLDLVDFGFLPSSGTNNQNNIRMEHRNGQRFADNASGEFQFIRQIDSNIWLQSGPSVTQVNGVQLRGGTISASDLHLSGNLYVSGSQSIDGVTFANGGVSATGSVTATTFSGSGAGLNNIPAAAIVGLNLNRISTTGVSSGANLAAVQADYGTVSFTLGGTPGAAYLHPSLGLVASGVSATGTVATVNLYASGLVGIGTQAPAGQLHIVDAVGSPSTADNIFRLETTGGNIGPSMRFKSAEGADYLMTATGSGNSGGAGAFRVYDFTLGRNRIWFANGAGGNIGMGTDAPTTALNVSGTLRIANGGEACDTNRLGAIRYTNGDFSICQNAANGWESLATTGANSLADRITSNSQAGVIANQTGYISLTTGGVTGTVYFAPNGRLVNTQISTTGQISSTDGYFTNAVRIGHESNLQNTLEIIRDSSREPNIAFYSGTNRGVSASQIRGLQDGGIRITNGDATAEFLRVTSGSLVGIGTQNPRSKLHIAGVSDSTAGGFTLADTLGVIRNQWYPLANGSSMLTIGNNGILNIGNDASNIFTRFDASTKQVFMGAGAGTSVPSTTLHVSGTLKIANGGEACDTNRLGAIKYQSNLFYICASVVNGWEPVATATSSTNPSINTGLSGSIVYRDEYGYLKARNDFAISATTGSVGIGGGAPSWVGNSGLYSTGNIGTGSSFIPAYGNGLAWDANTQITGDGTAGSQYLRFRISNTEALRIVSSGFVGIGTATPGAVLHVHSAPDTGTSGLLIGATTGSTNRLQLYPSGAGSAAMRLLSGGNLTIRDATNNTFVSFDGGTSRTIFGSAATPSSTLHVSGTLRIANGGEACDTDRLGAIKYTANAFYICQNISNGWEPLATAGPTSLADRITSNSQAGVIANSTGYISLTTGGVTGTVYFAPNGRLVTTQISTTGEISATTGYFSSNNRSLTIGDGSNASAYINVAGSRALFGYDGTAAYVRGGAGKDIYFMTSSTEALRIVSSGYVGIGTIEPSATLHIVGPYNNASGGLTIGITGSTNARRMDIFGTGSNSTNFRNYANGLTNFTNGAGTTLMRISHDTNTVGIGGNAAAVMPSTTLHVEGSVRLGAETSTTMQVCDANRLGAIKYQSGQFYFCRNGTTWETVVGGGAGSVDTDRITSSTSGVYVSDTGVISLVTAGSTPGYLNAAGLTINGVSTTGTISSTGLYVNGKIGINQSPTGSQALQVSGTGIAEKSSNAINLTLEETNAGSAAQMRLTNLINTFTVGNDSNPSGFYVAAPSQPYALFITSTGLVGLGTSTPSTTLTVSSSTGQVSFYAGSNSRSFEFSPYNANISMANSTWMHLNRSTNTHLILNAGGGNVGIGTASLTNPSTTLHVSGTLRIANGGESCDSNRLGAIKYENSAFYVCQNASNGWEAIGTTGANSLADRITSNSQAGVIANSTGYISLTTGGVTGTVYFTPQGKLVNAGVSTTGPISGTEGYFTGGVTLGGVAGGAGLDPTFTETDPKVGALVNGRLCRSNGTSVICDTPNATIDTDGNIAVSGSVQLSGPASPCSVGGDAGKLTFNTVRGKLQLCVSR